MGENGQPAMAMGETLVMENGRGFHEYRKGSYMYPCDNEELARLDTYHAIFRMLRDRRCLKPDVPSTAASLFSAPIRKPPERVLDVGTGSGFWAIDMADLFPTTSVVGMDLANIQPQAIPENVRFMVRQDFDDLWTLGQDSFDLIHMRCLNGSVSHWPGLYQKVFRHLKPGEGWIEHVEIDWEPKSANNQVPPDVAGWWKSLASATDRAGKPLAYQTNTVQMLRAQGFVDVEEQVYRLPLSQWSSDKTEVYLSRWGYAGMADSIPTLSLGPFTRINNWRADESLQYARRMLPFISNQQYQLYNNVHVVVGRRP